LTPRACRHDRDGGRAANPDDEPHAQRRKLLCERQMNTDGDGMRVVV